MRIKLYPALLLLLVNLLSKDAFAQHPISETGTGCGYTGKSPWLEWYQANRANITQARGDNDTAWLYVPITIHLVGTSFGTGHYKMDQALRAVCEMNAQFAEGRIRFYLMPGDPVRYHNNSAWNDHQYFPGGDEMINANRLPNRMNVFVVSNPAGNCGYAWQDAIVIGVNCSGPGNTVWAHEAGHHLSLPHPFVGWEGFSWNYTQPAPAEIYGHPVEKTDTSNCYFSADGFCDTRPDYLNYRWPCNSEQQSIVIQRDPDGVQFRSDATLIMGYAYDACASRFTPEQIEAMRSNIYFEHSQYLQIFDPLPEIDDNATVHLISPVDSQTVHFKEITFTWDTVPGATMYNLEIGLAPNFNPKMYNQVHYNTTSVTVTGGIPNNRDILWRVRAYSEWDVCQPNTNAQIGVFKTKNLTSTNDLERVAVAELSPNPVSGGLPAVLNVSSDEYIEAVLAVHDAAGRLCQSQNVRLSPGDNRINIATERLNTGIFIVSLRNERGALVKRLAIAE
ncbi:MAG: zinc-dependent metalloprotease [Saprospiraceae bacterium]|nr:zinc-dependent metalloprotease [Saprospiraceae bacterium]